MDQYASLYLSEDSASHEKSFTIPLLTMFIQSTGSSFYKIIKISLEIRHTESTAIDKYVFELWHCYQDLTVYFLSQTFESENKKLTHILHIVSECALSF